MIWLIFLSDVRHLIHPKEESSPGNVDENRATAKSQRILLWCKNDTTPWIQWEYTDLHDVHRTYIYIMYIYIYIMYIYILYYIIYIYLIYYISYIIYNIYIYNILYIIYYIYIYIILYIYMFFSLPSIGYLEDHPSR